MTLARTALRLAAVEALNADPLIASLCAGRVYDSRISELDAAEPVPVIVVLTEDASGAATSANNGGPPFFDRCELTLEVSLRIVAGDEAEQPSLMLVETDREAEARLDLLEHRAIEAVTVADTAQSNLLRRAVTRRATEYKSVRFTSDETGLKLAVRMVSLTVELKEYGPDHPTWPASGPYAALPEPLRSVANALPAGSSGRIVCDDLAALLAGTEAPAPALLGVTLDLGQRQLAPDAVPSRAEDAAAGRLVRQEVALPDWSA